MADALRKPAVRDRAAEHTGKWVNAYDRNTGLLRKSGEYYEGTLYNYSFRLLENMDDRIGLFRTPEAFVKALDRFFGYGAGPVKQPADPSDREHMEQGMALGRFEGYNNEPDIEAPYNYLYAGRHDRTCEVVRAGMKYMFAPGRGGCPGNNDSGGLSSCYVWNALGLFPVAGQPYWLLGSPSFREASISIGENTFSISAPHASEENIYVTGARLNGTALDTPRLWMKDVMRGGRLEVDMDARPAGWGHRTGDRAL
jgi:putative alpha-1,2-mannosidase